MEGLYLKRLQLGPLANLIYLIGSAESKEVAVVDPAWDVDAIVRAAAEDGVKITKILVSHRHSDHINGIPTLLGHVDVPVYVHEQDAIALRPLAGDNLQVVKDGDEIGLGHLTLRSIHTPGHTPGSQSFLVTDGVVSGDTLFVGSCGRVDLPESDPAKMYDSLQKLGRLPDDTVLYPGHNYGETIESSIAHERAHNPFLRIPSARDFLRFMGYS
jgi:glyoxylase-like metal-dependent hydrolase (beta-lactamase superfamily II)